MYVYVYVCVYVHVHAEGREATSDEAESREPVGLDHLDMPEVRLGCGCKVCM